MTISSTTNRNDYLGTGSTGPFAYTFRVFAATDLYVVKRSASGVETALTLNTDYTVTGVGDAAGGTVTLTAPLANGERLALLPAFDLVQTVDLRNQGTFFPETIEDALDYARSVDLQQQDQIDRSLKLPASVSPADVDPTLPVPQPDKVIGWDSTGTALVNKDAGTGGTGAVSSVFGRTGVITKQAGDYAVADVTGAAPLASPALTGAPTVNSEPIASKTYVDSAVAAATGAVASVFGRTGAIVKQAGDYAVADITGAAPLASPAFTGTPTVPTAAPGTNTTQAASTAFVATAVAAGSGAVASVFGRTGAIVKQAGDYAVADVTGAAPLASPALTGTPTAPTAAGGTNTTQIATTAFVAAAVAGGTGAVASVFGRTGAIVKQAGDYAVTDITGAAPLASPVFTGTPAAPTQASSDNSTRLATTAFVKTIFAGGIPGLSSDIPAYNVKASPYSAAGDGATDDTAAIQAAIDACSAAGGGIVYVPLGTYMINADYLGGKSVKMKSNVLLLGAPGSEFKAITNGLNGVFGIISANNVSNILIRGLTITGERSTHTGVADASSQYGMGVLFYQVSKARIEDCLIKDNWGDGIYLGSNNSGANPCQDIIIQGCLLDNNRRNNLSVVGCHRGAAIACGFTNANGVAPQAGVDIEPNFASETQDFSLISCWTAGNASSGMTITTGAQGCKIVGCSFRGDTGAAIILGPAVDALIADNVISDFTSTVRGAIDIGSGAVRTVVRGNILRNLQTGQPAIFAHGSATEPVIADNDISSTSGMGISVFTPFVVVRGNRLRDIGGIGINVGSTASDAAIDGNYVQAATGRAIYAGANRPYLRGNTLIDTATVVGAYMQLDTGASDAVVIGNVFRKTSADTTILALRIDTVTSAVATIANNVATGLKALKSDYVVSGLSGDKGDNSVTLDPAADPYENRWDTALTANRTVTLSTTRAHAGARFRIVRTGLGAFTLAIGSVKTMPANTAAWCEVVFDGTAWKLSGYGAL